MYVCTRTMDMRLYSNNYYHAHTGLLICKFVNARWENYVLCRIK